MIFYMLYSYKLTSIHFRFPIEIAFSAMQDREFLFHLKCRVDKKFAAILLNVKTKGYAIRLALAVKSTDGKEMLLSLDRDANRTIDFGEV